MGKTLGIHWAATTHGTWLHGDPRGSWLRGKLIGADPFLEAQQRALSRGAVSLDEYERELVAGAFGRAVTEWNYRVLAATIQPAHFHLVFAPLGDPINTVTARLKYRSSAAVLKYRRECLARTMTQRNPAGTTSEFPGGTTGLCGPRSLWTAGIFPVFIFSQPHLMNAIEYVRRHNRRIGLPDDPYDWIQALIPSRDGVLPGRDDRAIYSRGVPPRETLDRTC
jgi:REP element-mobilizing transposase RayT